MDCPTLLARWELFNRCIKARTVLAERCFQGGDTEHKAKLEDYTKGQGRCLDLISKKCRVDGQCK